MVEDDDHVGKGKYTIDDVVEDLIQGRMSKAITPQMVLNAYYEAEEQV
jgi:hypothetical protein